jgi:hypothetical protein
MNIKDHPAARHIPEPTVQPSVVADVGAFSSLFHNTNAPKTVSEYVGANIPQVALHVVVFRDSTALTLSWPHTFADGMGIMELFRAWISVLQDPSMAIPQPHGVDFDALADLGRNPTEPYKWLSRQLSLWQRLTYVCRSVSRYLLHPHINRVVCIPSSLVDSLYEEALRDLSEAHNGKPVFVSEGDVLFTWWARLVFSQKTQNMGQTLNLTSAASLRRPLSKDLLPPNSIYLSNAVGYLQTVLTKKDLLDEPIGYTAYRLRQTILEDTTREQIEAQHALITRSSSGLFELLGNSSMGVLSITNWRKMNTYNLDFSSAAKSGTRLSPESTVKPYYVQPCVLGGIFQVITPICFLLGRDTNRNYWISGSLGRNVWDHIEATLSRSSHSPDEKALG